MKIYAPDYYRNFSCIKDKCKHSCCVGWEIDIDEKTLEVYKNINSDFGKRITENIEENEDGSHFILSHNEHCPFLNENNLCDIIINLDENHLCQICSDHPRFRNFFDTRAEIGLGLCCEEVGRIILSHKEKVSLIQICTDENDERYSKDDEIFFHFRSSIIKEIQNRDIPIKQRILGLVSKYDISFPYSSPKKWAEIFMELERLDEKWSELLSKITDKKGALLENPDFEIQAEQLLVYFIFRHLSDGLYDGKLIERLSFAIISVMMIDFVLSVFDNFKTEDLIEISRLYSSEIEYSEENLKKLIQ